MTRKPYYVFNQKFEPTDSRLGRHIRHDSRSLNYQVPAGDVSQLKSIRHHRNAPILDQGSLGSCTGNAATGALSFDFFMTSALVQAVFSGKDARAVETFAINVYSEATTLDAYNGVYPPVDTGSDGLSVAQVLQKRGLISGYLHATSIEAVLTALAVQPSIVGTNWYEGMFNPDQDGRLQVSGNLAGGHEYVLSELDVENRRVWMDNSWGEHWGIDGRAYLTWDDLAALLKVGGDNTVFVPLTQPPPTPTPVPVTDPKQEFIEAAQAWNMKLRRGGNAQFQKKLTEFLSWYA